MKRFLCAFLAVSLLLLLAIPAGAGPRASADGAAACPDYFAQNPLPIDDWPELSAVDADTAWVVSLGGLILKTTDAGETWQAQWSEVQEWDQQPPLRAVSAVDGNVAWICGDSGVVLVTSNGGATWSYRPVGLDLQLFGIAAVDDRVAFAVGQAGLAFGTVDGGATWNPLPIGVPNDLNDVWMVDDQTAWVCGDGSTILYTTDGGANWTPVDLGFQSSLTRVRGFSANKVYLVGDSGDFFWTDDGGTSFHAVNMGNNVQLFGMSFLDEQTGWISGSSNSYVSCFLAKTTDGGTGWRVFRPTDLSTERNMTAISAASGDIAWTCSVDGAIARTTDGGGRWVRLDTSATRAALFSVNAVDQRSAWAVGSEGTILRTSNGGRSWVSQQSGVSSDLYSIDAADSRRAWAAGTQGTILRTDDYGGTWRSQTSGTTTDLYSVAAGDTKTAWACGYDQSPGVVLHTGDAGEHWSTQKILPETNVDSIGAFDQYTAWFGAADVNGGYIYATDDGGATWRKRTLTPPAPVQHFAHFRDIEPVSDKVCFALAETVAFEDYFMCVYKTTDGGNTWSLVGGHFAMADSDMFQLAATADGPKIASCGALANPYVEPNVAFVSTNGGVDWVSQKAFHRTVMFGIDTLDGSTNWMVGYSGTIMRSTCPSVFSVSPSEGYNAGPVDIVDITGSGFWDGMRVWLENDGTRVEASGVDVASPYKAACTFNLDGLEEGPYDVVTRNANGLESRLDGGFTVASPNVWYLAEGSTGVEARGSFETWVEVENPNADEARVDVTYMTPSGTVAGPHNTMPPESRQTINVADTVPNEFSVSTRVESDRPLAVEWTTYWNTAGGERGAALGSIGLNRPAQRWYLAEGSTGAGTDGSFETWILVQNPSDSQAMVRISYLTPDGAVEGPHLTIDPGTRQTVNVADTVPNEWDVSTIVESDISVCVERSMYWNPAGGFRQAGLDSVGASNAASQWYFAEGSTADSGTGSFETWITLQNPFADAAVAQLNYQGSGGKIAGPEVTLEPFTRKTVNVADTVADDWSVSTTVLADAPVVAERSTYWNASEFRQVGQGSIGATAPFGEWLLAEGSTGAGTDGSFETWILVQNPGDQAAQAKLTYMLESGTVDGPTVDLPPSSRISVNVADTVPGEWSVSTKVTSADPLVVESAMYWNADSEPRRAGRSSKGCATYGLP
ncbi:MAG: DUF5719 family protein [Actinomycetota bacterium]